MNIGIAIKTIRTHFGISQEDLSLKTGISQTSISQIENGLKNPSKRTIKKICDVFQIPEAIVYIIGVDHSDVPESRKKIFDQLFPQIKELAIQIIGNRKSKLIQGNQN